VLDTSANRSSRSRRPAFMSLDSDSVLRLRFEGKGRGTPRRWRGPGRDRAGHRGGAPEVASIVFEAAPVGAEALGRLVQLNGRKTHGPGRGRRSIWASWGRARCGPWKWRSAAGGVQHQRRALRIPGHLRSLRVSHRRWRSRGQHLTCPSCGQRYDLRLAGRASDGSPLQLDPLPLLADATGVRDRLAGGCRMRSRSAR